MCDNLDHEKKNNLKKRVTKEKKAKGNNLGNNEKEQLRKYEKKGKKIMCDHLDDEKKNI